MSSLCYYSRVTFDLFLFFFSEWFWFVYKKVDINWLAFGCTVVVIWFGVVVWIERIIIGSADFSFVMWLSMIRLIEPCYLCAHHINYIIRFNRNEWMNEWLSDWS